MYYQLIMLIGLMSVFKALLIAVTGFFEFDLFKVLNVVNNQPV